jgi:DinB superfamily
MAGPILTAPGRTVAAMTIDWTHEAIEQLDWHWREHLRPDLADLTDAEYLWEPVPGCWSVRLRAAAASEHALGGGDVVRDWTRPPPRPAPFTTIAWRLAHLTIGVFGARASAHFDDGSFTDDTAEWTLGAADALDRLDHWYDKWMAGVRARGASGIAEPCGPAEGPFADAPFGGLVLHISREAIHHGAEVLLLRDLYRSSGLR